jgi:hypothetical protein
MLFRAVQKEHCHAWNFAAGPESNFREGETTAGLIPHQRRLHVPFNIHIRIVGDVEQNLFDRPTSELRLRSILAAYGIAAVVADTQSLTA